MLFSEATNHPVMSIDRASTVATIGSFLVDPATATVVAMRVKRFAGRGDTLHWQDLTAFGLDAVTIPSAQVIGQARDTAAELARAHPDLIGKRLLTDTGAELGVVTDVDFNPANGAVVELLTSGGPIQGDRLIGCGSYAVVVKDV